MKSWLVAQREFMENLRTKTFWVGILFFPVLLVLGIVVPGLLEKTKKARAYAVLDHSGWLAKEVKGRSDFPDMKLVLEEFRESVRSKSDDLDAFPEALRDKAATFARLTDAELDKAARVMTTLYASPEGEAMLDTLEEEQAKAIRQSRETIKNWYDGLESKQAERFKGSLDRKRYELVAAPEGAEAEEILREKLARGELFAFFVIGPQPELGSEGCKYVSNNLTDGELKAWYSRHADQAVQERRFRDAGVDQGQIAAIQTPLIWEGRQIGSSGAEAKVENIDRALQFIPIAFVYLLWIAIFSIAQMLLTNTIEEKSNRTIEVLLSSVSPFQLMSGKIAGIAMTGLTVVCSWVVFFITIVKASLRLGFSPPFDPTPLLANGKFLGCFVLYFLLGYLLYAALLVGIGSVCNSLKEAQNLMMPVSVVLMVPLFSMFPIVQDPNGTLARVLSWIPITAPFAMMNRAAADVPWIDWIGSTILILGTIAAFFFAAAKVFRIGILMTGKPPRFGEIIRWISAPVGSLPERKS